MGEYNRYPAIVYNSIESGILEVWVMPGTDDETALLNLFPDTPKNEYHETDLNVGKGIYYNVTKTPDSVEKLFRAGFAFSETAMRESIRILLLEREPVRRI